MEKGQLGKFSGPIWPTGTPFDRRTRRSIPRKEWRVTPARPPAQLRQPYAGLEHPPKIVRERLGHSSIAITMDIYSHLMPNMQGEAAAAVDVAMRAAINKRIDDVG